jgi:hypothetical protein
LSFAARGVRVQVGAQSVVLAGGYLDDRDEGEWFLYTGSGGRDLSGNKRTNNVRAARARFPLAAPPSTSTAPCPSICLCHGRHPAARARLAAGTPLRGGAAGAPPSLPSPDPPRPPPAQVQSFDQEFSLCNEALRVSCVKGLPVRVLRSYKEKRSAYAPTDATPVGYPV